MTFPKGFRDSVVLEAALEHRAFRLLRRVESRLRRDAAGGRSSSEAWNRALVEVRRRGGGIGWAGMVGRDNAMFSEFPSLLKVQQYMERLRCRVVNLKLCD